jgi:threonine synthase
MVKEVFAQDELNSRFNLTSANSINIARLVPQMVYYVSTWATLTQDNPFRKVTFIVPSGNFGNLTAGVLAAHMGMPNVQFITATNANDVVPEFLEGSDYTPRTSVSTISNAMDVGSPSNFERLEALYGGNHAALRSFLKGDRVSDVRTREVIKEVYTSNGYVADPHTATGIEVWNRYKEQQRYETDYGVVLATAHPAKFIEVMEEVLPGVVTIPERLASLRQKDIKSTPIGKTAQELINLL